MTKRQGTFIILTILVGFILILIGLTAMQASPAASFQAAGDDCLYALTVEPGSYTFSCVPTIPPESTGTPTSPAPTETGITPTATLASPTAPAGTPSRTPRVTPGAPTATPTQPSGTTPPPPPPTVTPGPTGIPGDETKWHPPNDHHHGFNPRDYAAVFSIDGFDLDAWLDENGEVLQPAWATVNENPLGAIWLYVHADSGGCEMDFEGVATPTPEEFDCITDVLYRIHDVGTLDHVVNRFHSEAFIIKACEKGPDGQAIDTPETCGIAAGGAQPDYGPLHTPYKQDICHIANEPPNYPDSKIDQPPYRTAQVADPRDGFVQQYWVNSDPNAIVKAFYPTGTNWLFNSAWLSMDAWQVFPEELVCDQIDTLSMDQVKALLMGVPPVATSTHTVFKLNDITLRAHPPGPFDALMDLYGGLCEEGDPVCVPLFISDHFPDSPVTLHRGAEPGQCEPDDENPCIFIDVGGATMVFPGGH